MDELTFQTGEIIFREDEESDHAYRILSGKVEVYKRIKKGTVLLAVLGEGEMLGEMGIINQKPRSAYAAATTEVRLKVISRDYLGDLLRSQHEDVTLLIRVLMERLLQSNETISDIIARIQAGKMDETPPPVHRVTLTPLTAHLKEQMSPKGVVIASFPFRIGAIAEDVQPNPLDWNNLYIKSDGTQLMARNHFTIQRGPNGLQVSDRGTKTGTIVNDKKIGGNETVFKADLYPGDNTIVAGGDDSPYRFNLTWE